MSEPKKFDANKPRYDLLPPKALGLLVDCLTYGAKKYNDDYNWRKDGGIDPNRLFAATQRHLWAWKDGETMDKESGLPHLAHAATNLLMMLDLASRPPVKIPNFSPPSAVAALEVGKEYETKSKPRGQQNEVRSSFFSLEEQHMYRERFAEVANALKPFKNFSEALLDQSEEERKLMQARALEVLKPPQISQELINDILSGATINAKS